GEAARIVALADRHEANAFGDLRVEDAMDAERGLFDAHAERAGDRARDRLAAAVGLKLHAVAGQVLGMEIAEHDRGVGPRRLAAAEAVARRAGFGARRLRADAHAARAVEPGDRAAARADRVHVDHADAHRITVDAALRTQRRHAVLDQ